MRRYSAVALAVLVAACGDNGATPDAHVHTDAPAHDSKDTDSPVIDIDGPPDAFVFHDAPPIDTFVPDAAIPDGIGDALGTADGTGLTLAINNVTVTYLKPQIGSTTNDPAGFTVQAQQPGPALFVSVDPTTLTPPAAVGDVVSFTITTMGTVAMQRRAQAITSYTRSATGANIGALVQDLSAATDVVSNLAGYDSEVVDVTGTFADAFASGGAGFQRSTITSAGITGDTNFQFRAPATLVDALDMVPTCGFTAHHVPVNRFNAAAEIGVYVAGDVTLTACPAPVVASAIALSATTVRVTFSRNIAAGSLMMDGSQFTFDHGLMAMSAVASGRTVTLTTLPQTGGQVYTVTVANTVTDLQGTALGATNTAMFTGYSQAAVVRINEINANIASSCDLIELRVVSGGSMAGFKIQERVGGSGQLSYVFPSFNVQTNDFIVIHENSASATCNPNAATTETVTKTDQPAATFAGNIDTAYDFWVTDAGLTATDNVFTLYDASGAIIDALFASDDPAATNGAADTLTQAGVVGTANQWSPAMTTYTGATFRPNAADDLNATGTTAAGTSIQRVNDLDTNGKADWTTGAGAASTWGALNPGQVAF